MKLPCFIYGPESRTAKNLKDCVRESLRRCREHEQISSPDMREFWCSRAMRIVRWSLNRWPNPEPAAPGLPTLAQVLYDYHTDQDL